jgi:hypothetical protein
MPDHQLPLNLRSLADDIERGQVEPIFASWILEDLAAYLIGPTENAANCGEAARVCPECDGVGGAFMWMGRSEVWPPLSFEPCAMCERDGTVPIDDF